MKYSHSYLVTIQFLGFRFHGWQKQPDTKTLHQALDKTLEFTFGHNYFKTVGMGRTDSKVSASHYTCQLLVLESLHDENLVKEFNENAPADLRMISVRYIQDKSFSIISASKQKTYHYYFSNQGKNHPYAAPFMSGFENLNIELMITGAKLFEGTHFFGSYCTKPSSETKLIRTVDFCEIVENTYLRASFFPEKSYVLIVKGSGFLRYQIRLMMGALLELGAGKMSLVDIQKSLSKDSRRSPISTIAPGSGLHLHQVTFEKYDA